MYRPVIAVDAAQLYERHGNLVSWFGVHISAFGCTVRELSKRSDTSFIFIFFLVALGTQSPKAYLFEFQ